MILDDFDDSHPRLEKRIDAALLSGAAGPREMAFLHSISMLIHEYGKNTRLSDRQAEYLFDILERVERRLEMRS